MLNLIKTICRFVLLLVHQILYTIRRKVLQSHPYTFIPFDFPEEIEVLLLYRPRAPNTTSSAIVKILKLRFIQPRQSVRESRKFSLFHRPDIFSLLKAIGSRRSYALIFALCNRWRGVDIINSKRSPHAISIALCPLHREIYSFQKYKYLYI